MPEISSWTDEDQLRRADDACREARELVARSRKLMDKARDYNAGRRDWELAAAKRQAASIHPERIDRDMRINPLLDRAHAQVEAVRRERAELQKQIRQSQKTTARSKALIARLDELLAKFDPKPQD
jgi:hypothetical protein